MFVKIKDKEYKIEWAHCNISTYHYGINGSTICKIYEVGENGIVAEGIAECSVKDNYCKETGRKVSLTRALNQRMKGWGNIKIFNQEERKIFWDTYLNRKELSHVNG